MRDIVARMLGYKSGRTSHSRFKPLRPFASATIILGGVGIFYPPLVSIVVALAAVFVGGVVVVTGEFVVEEMRKQGSPR